LPTPLLDGSFEKNIPMRSFMSFRHIFVLCSFFILIGSCKKTDSLGNSGNNNGTPAVTAVGTTIGNPVTKNIGAAGGSIASEDGRVHLTIPAGALSVNTNISIQAITNQCPGGIGVAYDFQPNGTKFAIPALLRFNYADSEVNGTDPYLLYVAFQDSADEWELIDSDKDIDTVGKTASFDISHFTGMAMVPYIQILADKYEYHEGESGTLTIFQWGPSGSQEAGRLTPPSPVPTNKLGKWALNGDGSIKGNGASATYTAPSSIPQEKSVDVSVVVQDTKTVRLRKGKTITFNNKSYGLILTLLTSIVDFDIYINMTFDGGSDIYDDVYTDSAEVQIEVDLKNSTVKTIGIFNFKPDDKPSSGTNGTTSATWVPDDLGMINIASLKGILTSDKDSVVITFTHIGTIIPKFTYTNVITGTYTGGGSPVPGFPSTLWISTDINKIQHITTNEAFVVDATVIPVLRQ
jgi:hypothetical protein